MQRQVLLLNANKDFKNAFLEESKKQGITCTTALSQEFILDIHNGTIIPVLQNNVYSFENTFVFIRLAGKDIYFLSILAQLYQHTGIPFTDDINIHSNYASSKITQMIKLTLAGLAVPDSIICSLASYKQNRDYIQSRVQYPCVLKKKGGRGEFVWKIENKEELESMLLQETEIDPITKAHNIFLIQEYIPNTYDTRVALFKGEIIRVIDRIANDGFYNNYSRGADFQYSEISKEEYDLCVRACAAVDLDFAGVDFVRTKDNRILFFEVNKSPQINVNYMSKIVETVKKTSL